MSMFENRKIFRDTMSMCGSNQKLAASIENTIKKHSVYKEKDELDLDGSVLARFEDFAEVKVSKLRTFEAARQYAGKGRKVCALNFANSFRPGGGVIEGCTAQEECLCRISTLYSCLAIQDNVDKFYDPHRASGNPFANDDIIYTPDVTVFKTDTLHPELMDEKDWYQLDVITAAAPDLSTCPESISRSSDFIKNLGVLHIMRGSRIMDVALSQGVDTIIVGAFGCGAFSNDPNIVAKAYQAILADYIHAFRTIEFAIYCPEGQETENYKVFRKVILGE